MKEYLACGPSKPDTGDVQYLWCVFCGFGIHVWAEGMGEAVSKNNWVWRRINELSTDEAPMCPRCREKQAKTDTPTPSDTPV